MKNLYEPGQEVETTVVQVSSDTVFIDLGLKAEGIVDKADFSDGNGNFSVKEGDRIKVFFVGNKDGSLYFTAKISAGNAEELLESAFRSGLPVEGHVEKEIKGGFEVKFGQSRAFCPYSQMGFRNRLEPGEYVGRTLTFVISEFKNDGKDIIVSNRKYEEQQENDKIRSLSRKIHEGDVVKGTVKSLQSYGAFVDLGGFQALLPVSEISHQRVNDISEVLSAGQEIEAKVISTEWNEQKPERSRISLSLKAVEKDPWEDASSLSVGGKITGKIARIAPFGLFVNLKPGIDGLVHISALQDVNDKTNLSRKFKAGDDFDVVIQNIDAAGRRISLAPAESNEQDKDAGAYLSRQDSLDSGETYSPFAALLKK